MSADDKSISVESEQVIDEQDASVAENADALGDESDLKADPTVIRGNVFGEDLADDMAEATLVEPPTEGKMSLDADGNFVFEPGTSDLEPGEILSVVFSYQFTDETGQVIVRQATITGTTEDYELTSEGTNPPLLTSPLNLLIEDYDQSEVTISIRSDDGLTSSQIQNELKLSLAQNNPFAFVEFSYRSVLPSEDFSVEGIIAALRAGRISVPEGGALIDQSSETQASEIISGAGDDIIIAGSGGDIVGYKVGQGNDTIEGGEGFDLLFVDLSTADDSADPSVLSAPANVSITAVNGNVVLDGGSFELTLNGLEEILLTGGDAGGSFVIGDLTGTDIADDTIILIAGDGGVSVVNDSDRSLDTRGSSVADTLTGGSSTDLLFGREGNDSLDGRGGNDTLFGGAGVDTLDGGAGNDVLIYGRGDDHDGGTGTDSLRVTASSIDVSILLTGGFSNIEIVDFVDDGRADVFTIDFESAQALVTDGQTELKVQGGSGDQVFLTNTDWIVATGGNQVVEDGVTYNVYNAERTETIDMPDVVVNLVGETTETTASDFRLLVENSVSVVLTTDTDRPTFPDFPTKPQDDESNQLLGVAIGGIDIPSPETLFNDAIGAENPLVRAAINIAISNVPGISQLSSAVATFNQAVDAVSGFIDAFSGTPVTSYGSEGSERIEYSGDISNLAPDLSDEDFATALADVQGAITDLAINFVIKAVTAIISDIVGGPHIVFAGSGNDIIEGHSNAWDDFFDGGAGIDTMIGGEGNDIYVVGDPGDEVIEKIGEGVDAIRISSNLDYTIADNVENLFGAGSGTIVGNDLNNYLGGNSGGNNLRGGAGNDTLNGKGGDDTLTSDAGIDFLFGGAGNDTYVIGDTDDIIFENQNAGIDTVSFGGLGSGVVDGQSIDLQALEFTARLYGTIENVVLGDTLIFDVKDGRPANLNGFGNQLDNFLQGNKGNNLLVGRDGDDTLIGGAESLNGVDGFDTLEGGAGDDVYLVSGNADIIVDIDGNDRIELFRTATPLDAVIVGTDFAGADITAIKGFSNDEPFTYTLPDTSIIETLVIQDVKIDPRASANEIASPRQDINAVGGAGNNFIQGNIGNNTLTARGGNDTLDGGAGNDTLNADSGADTSAGDVGDSILRGGSGNDLYRLFRDGDSVQEVEAQFFGQQTIIDGGNDTIESIVSVNLLDFSVDTTVVDGNRLKLVRDSFIENIVLTGADDLNATGDDANNTLKGNAGSNLLIGGLGNDRFISLDNTIDKIIDLLPTEVVNFLRFTDTAGNYDFQAVFNAIKAELPAGLSMPEGGAEVVLRSLGERAMTLERADLVIENLSADVRADFFNGEFTRGDLAPQVFRVLVDDLFGNVTLSESVFDDVLDRILTNSGQRTKSLTDQVIDATPDELIDALLVSEFSEVELRSRLEDAIPDGLSLPADDTVTLLGNLIRTAQAQTLVDEAQAKVEVTDALGTELTAVFNRMADAIADPSSSFSGLFEELVREAIRTPEQKANLAFAVNNFFDLAPTTLLNQLGDQALFDLIFSVANKISDNGNNINNGVSAELASQRADVVERLLGERIDNETGDTAIDHLASLVRANSLGFPNGVNSVSETINALQNSDDVFVSQTDLILRIYDLLPEGVELPTPSFSSGDTQAIVFGSLALGATATQASIINRLPLVKNAEQVNRIVTDAQYAEFQAQFTSDPFNAPLGFRQLVSDQFNTLFSQSLALYQQIQVFRGDRELNNDLFEALDPVILALTPDVVADLFGIKFDAINNSLVSIVTTALDGRVSLENGVTLSMVNDIRDRVQIPKEIDTLQGGEGNDTYEVNDLADVLVELANQGDDTVIAKVENLVLLEHFETLILGNGIISGTGNGKGSLVRGNSEDNYIVSGTGIDSSEGGAGNDTFVVNDAGDQVAGGSGLDTVLSSVSFTGAGDVEIIKLTGSENINAIGNGILVGNNGNNSLLGGGGADSLVGGAGNDTLFGGEDFSVDTLEGGDGDDTYIVSSNFFSTNPVRDVILDSGGNDVIVLPAFIGLDVFELPTGIEGITISGGGSIDFDGNFQANRLTGNDSSNTIRGNEGNDTIIGGGGGDFLFGDAGDDVLDGEHMFGGSGNDTYKVTNAGFLIVDTSGSADAVESTVTYAQDAALRAELIALLDESTVTTRTTDDLLADAQQKAGSGSFSELKALIFEGFIAALPSLQLGAIEKITLTGDAAINATGATSDEQIIGNDANNILSGLDGNDTLTGNGGDDTLIAGAGTDSLIGGAGNDRYEIDAADTVVETTDGGLDTVASEDSLDLVNFANVENIELLSTTNANATGNNGANLITGNSGHNQLSGLGGNDTLVGGRGDDTYTVTVGEDTVTESAGNGSDTVKVNASINLADDFQHIEDATLLEVAGNANLTGDANDNVLTGNTGANTLDGGGGQDTLIGGDGGDTYVVDDAGDVISESGASGTDLVKSSFTYTLSSTLENLTLTGTANIDATGNAGNNTIIGNSGDNAFVGGGGNDAFSGGAGNDTFHVEDFDTVTEVREFRVTENQTLIGSIADLFDPPTLSAGDSIGYSLFGEDANLFNVDEDGLVTFVDGQDFEIAGDENGDNVYDLTISATRIRPGANFLAFGTSAFNVVVTDEINEEITLLAGVGNEKVTQLFVDGSGTQFSLLEGDDRFTVSATGEVRFISTQQFVNGVESSIVKVGVTQNGVTNVVTFAVAVADNPDGRVDTISRVKTINIEPLKDISSDTVRISDPSFPVVLQDEVENLILVTAESEILTGNTRDNVITGNIGSDTLDGGEGADTLRGGEGNDTYTVEANDTIEELLGQGVDTVNTSGNFTLSDNLENLTLTGSDDINGTGNGDVNVITGNAGNNILSGAGGNDTLVGNSGNDTLDGGTGNDSLRGGLGNDVFIVDGSDIVEEGLNQGTDTVQTTLNSFSLASLGNVENLTFTGTGANTGSGNALNNTIIGNSGNDTVDGGAGNDRLEGKAGDDVFTVDSSSDVVVELANEGTDTVNSSASFTLATHVENLILTGSANVDGTGNASANTLTGNAGANRLQGLDGDDTFVYTVADSNDTLEGGGGTDTLDLTGSDLDLNLDSVSNMTGIEVINFAGTGGHTLTLDETSLTAISGGTLKVLGDSSDKVVAKGDWTLQTDNSTDASGRTIDIYQLGSSTASLQVQDGVTVSIVDPQPVINVGDLDGTNGIILDGGPNDSWYDFEVGNAGDLNGDGFDDVVVGVSRAFTTYDDEYGYTNFEEGGRAFVVFGADGGLGANVDLDSLNGTNGFTLDGTRNSLGSGVSGGDFNGDGIDDLLVGDKNAGYNNASFPGYSANGREGISYVVYGVEDNMDGSSNFVASIQANTLEATGVADGGALRAVGAGADSGENVANIGDFNGDGIDDFIISGSYRGVESQREGGAYIVFGTTNGFDGTVNLEKLNGSNGIEITARGFATDQIGFNVESAGDINGDGLDDVVMTSNRSGDTHVIFGTDTGVSEIDVGDLDNTNGFELIYGGGAVSGGGDINGDGFDDLVITSDGYGAFVLFGAADMASVMGQLRYDGGYYGSNNLYALDPAPVYGGESALGFRIIDSDYDNGEYLGNSVAIVGDVNGDGFDDIIIGAQRTNAVERIDSEGGPEGGGEEGEGPEGGPEGGGEDGEGPEDGPGGYSYAEEGFQGQAFVVFGGSSTHDGKLDVATLDGTNGFKIEGGYDYLGLSVGAAGDVNGDGFDDVILGEKGQYLYNDNENIEDYISEGTAYIIFGKDFAGDAGTIGTSGADTLAGGSGSVIRGGAGDDEIRITNTDFFRIDGGGGNDTLVLDGSGLSLNFDELSNRSVQDIEKIDITGSGNNTLTIDHLQAGDLLGTGLTLQVDGNAGDVVNLLRGSVVTTSGGNNIYTRQNTVISVANTVTVNELQIAPAFFNDTAFTVNENTTAVVDLTTRDRNGDSISYSITGGNDQAVFSVDASTGELNFIAAPNFENPQSPVVGGGVDNLYEVVVTATDDSSSTLATNHAISVTVADVEDAPVITTGAKFSDLNVDLINNALLGVIFTATDEDSASVGLSLSGDDAASFGIFNSSTVPGTVNGTLRVGSAGTAANDADGDRVYEFVLTATDSEGNQTSQNIEIGLTRDANRLPQFDVGNTAAVTITEGTAVDIGAFTATDFDNDNEVISYSLADDLGGKFAINATTGALTFTGTYDDAVDPAANTYQVTLQATDNAGGGETGTSLVDVTVAYDVLLNDPVIGEGDENLLPLISNFTNDNAGEILDFSTLLSDAGGPRDESAFSDGWLNFRFFGSDIIIQFDSDGGGDGYENLVRLTGMASNLEETDLDGFIF